MRLNLPSRSHDKTSQRVGEMSVFGEVVRFSTCGHDDHDWIHVREMVRSKDDRAASRNVMQASHAEPEEEPHPGVEQHAEASVVRIAEFDLVRGADPAASNNGRPSLLGRLAHVPPSRPEVSIFTADGGFSG